ncbi:MAG TPA: hypothetical protein VN950_19390 [Terriglobales bacterium]|nr:hypothetical protein [Terriglobales bacterium]
MKPLLWILQSAFGCRHGQMSRVFTIEKRTYRVCFKCGKEFGYSWASMHPLRSSAAVNTYAPLDHVEQAKIPAV